MLLSFLSCRNNDKNHKAVNLQKVYENSSLPIPPADTKAGIYYHVNNYLIDDDGKYYFYKINLPELNSCSSESEARPKFINLKPENLVELPKHNFKSFVLKNKKTESKRNGFCISSARDTFDSPEISRLIDEIAIDKENTWIYLIRTMTQEERIVLEYKKKQKHYDAAKIKWDTTKIVLPKNTKALN